MSKFKFRLATLLRLREAARDQRREELAEAYRVDDVLRERLRRVGEELGWLKHRCRKVVGPGTVDVDGLVEAQRYELTLRARQQELGQQCETVAEEIRRRQRVLVEANRDVRVLEKLRQNQARNHRCQQARRETKQLDEMAQQRFVREEAG